MKMPVRAILLSALLFSAAAHSQSFCSNVAIAIPGSGTLGVASVYPSTITVSGAVNPLTQMRININGLSHTFPSDIDMLLVGPGGQKMIIQSDVGGAADIANLNYVIDDRGPTTLPSAALTESAYQPTDYGSGDVFVAPAPAGPYADATPIGAATLTSTFFGTDPNGIWQLYVIDDLTGDSGSMAGWCLSFGLPPLKISEYRARGPSGANDEYIELMNASDAEMIVASSDGSSGFAVAASDGVARCVISNNTVIKPYNHYLCANSISYSLSSYPAASGTNASANGTFSTDIPDNAGVAVFNTSDSASFNFSTRLDAIGSTSEANSLYKEGAGFPTIVAFSIDDAFARDTCGNRGSITSVGLCHADGFVVDTGSNAADFIFVDTNGTSAGAGQRLGSPGPEHMDGPQYGSGHLTISPLDSCVSNGSSPNFVRDFTSDPSSNSTFGRIDIRTTITNHSGVALTSLRFRIAEITTFPAPAGYSDLRPITSTATSVLVDQPPCGSGTSFASVGATTLEQPPSQINGGGFNSSLGVPAISPGSPLADGASINVRFLFGVQQTGSYKIVLVPEGVPVGGGPGDILSLYACTDGGACVDFIFHDGFNPY